MAGSEDDGVPEAKKRPPREIDSEPSAERPAHLPEETSLEGLPSIPDIPEHFAPKGPVDTTRPPEPPERPSLLDELLVARTTVNEVGKAARRLSVVALGLSESRRVVRQLVLSGIFGLLLALGVALVFAGGTLRLVLGILAGTCIAALVVFLTLRGVGKLADRFGARTLPGSPWLWLGAVLVLALGGTWAVSLSLWEVTKLPALGPKPATPMVKVPPVAIDAERADDAVKRGAHERIPRGVIYAPPAFESIDGQFDVVIHFHGNVELVEQSVVAAGLNALVVVINVGDGSGVYTKEMQGPYAFDRLLTTIEERARDRLRLENPMVRRIALSAWSAGFASVVEILGSRSRFDRVDAVLLMDTPHAKYAPGSDSEVWGPSIEPFAAFARRAMAGQKLMIVTHSAIETEGYPSTTQTTDALLKSLGMERETVAPESASPRAVDLPVAVQAFPSGERNWMQVVSRVTEQNFAVYGCTGKGKGDHIAHLAQMSVTVLPPLRERWQ